jgi:tetratricopeptide (TPR) repeat protein
MNAPLRIISETNPRAQRHRGHLRVVALVLLVVAMVPGWAKEPSQLVNNALAVGDEMYSSQKYEQALKEYEKVIVADPTHWQANYKIALSYLALYHPGSTQANDLEYADKSAEAFERLMTLQAPDLATAERVRNYYVSLLIAANRTDRVIAFYEELLGKDPRNPTLVSQLAEIYAKKGDFDKALNYYMQRTEIEPTNKGAWYTIGVVCWDRVHNLAPALSSDDLNKTIETAIDALGKALAIDSSYFEALVYMNLIYREKSSVLAAQMKNEEADEALSKAEDYRSKAMEIGKKRMAGRN